MTMKKSATENGGHALAAIRDLWRDGNLDGSRVRTLGKEYGLQDCIDFTADSATLGETQLLGLVLAAARSPGFSPATNTLDKEISTFCDGSWGRGRWQTDRPPHLWEKGGGDEQLDRLITDQEIALADLKKATEDLWAARDESAAARQGPAAVTEGGERALTKALSEAIKAWEHADERASLARSRVTSRALWLQDKFRRQQAAKGL